jgi:hypothetical protein
VGLETVDRHICGSVRPREIYVTTTPSLITEMKHKQYVLIVSEHKINDVLTLKYPAYLISEMRNYLLIKKLESST